MKLLRRILYAIRQRRVEAELAEEIETHRAMRQRDLEARGLTPIAAADASRRALGNTTLAREEARATWIAPWVESVWQDAVYAIRILRRAPAFASAVILVIAIGIGATTGVFGLLDGLVLRSLPVGRPERLVYFAQPSFSYPIYQDVAARMSPVLSSLSAWNLTGANLEWPTGIEPAEVLTASGNFYETLALDAVTGRTFGPGDDRIGGGAYGLVAVVSHAAAERRFGAVASALGRTVGIDGKPFTIVGVTPRGFAGVAPGLEPELTIPLLASVEDAAALRSHSSSWIHLLGRVRDGVTIAQADAALQAVWPSVMETTTPVAMPADRRALYLGRQTRLESGHAGYSRVRNQFQEALWLLLALVGLLTAVACASAANLLFARGLARRKEIAMRLAIGAGRWRVVRQMVTEAAVWTAIAAVAGVGIGAWAGAGLVAMMTTYDNPIVIDLAPGWRVLGFAVALAFASAAVASVVPALRATRLDPWAALKGIGPAGGGAPRWSMSRMLVAAQVALTIVLLVGAALFVRSLQRVLSEDAGVDRDRVLVVATDPGAVGYGDDRFAGFYERLLERVRALPGVEAAAVSQYPPISDQDGAWTQSIEVEGVPLALESARRVHFNAVSPDYFRALGMRVVRGRDFTARDDQTGPRVVAINESLARRFFDGRDPLGRRMTIGRDAARRNLEIVAVVSDSKYQRLQEPARAIAFLPCAQLADRLAGRALFADIRTAGPAGRMADAVRREVRALDPRLPVRLETVDDRIRSSVVRERVMAALAATLGVAALALACAALYGLLAYAVSRRAHEIGVRIAIGATPRAVVWQVLREGLLLAIAGTAAGGGVALALGRYARTLLYEVTPADGLSFGLAALLMLAVAVLAAAIPARRAAHVDPAVALRSE